MCNGIAGTVMPNLSDPYQVFAYLALAGLAGVMIWAVWRGRAEFVIRIRDGRPQTVQGTVGSGFLRDLEEICQREGISAGRIRGVRRGRSVTLEFSRQIPAGCRQPIRNVWSYGGSRRASAFRPTRDRSS